MDRLDDVAYRLLIGLAAGALAYKLLMWFYEQGYQDGKVVGRLQGLKVGSFRDAPKQSEHYAD